MTLYMNALNDAMRKRRLLHKTCLTSITRRAPLMSYIYNISNKKRCVLQRKLYITVQIHRLTMKNSKKHRQQQQQQKKKQSDYMAVYGISSI